MREARYRISRKNLIMDIDYEQLAAQIRAGEVMALFCRNDRLAVKTIRSLRERGLRIPPRARSDHGRWTRGQPLWLTAPANCSAQSLRPSAPPNRRSIPDAILPSEARSLRRAAYYPLIDPTNTPFTKYFCKNGYTHNMGKVTITVTQYFTSSR